MSEYRPFAPEPIIQVDCLYTMHYSQFACGYLFPGEQHNFWEMVYIDRGEADIGAGETVHRLSQGQVIFHKPDEFHSIWANAAQGTNIFVITFASRSPAMQAFQGLRTTLGESQRRLISRMIREGQNAFGPLLNSYADGRLAPLPDAPEGSAQLIVLYLTQLLLELLRAPRAASRSGIRVTEDTDFAPAAERIIRLMLDHPDGSLRFETFCRETGYSSTVLKERFKRCTGSTVMAYYQRLRLEESCRLLRQGRRNISQIAAQLGYSSPQAFTRQFKRLLGVSPGEYLRMVKA